MASRWREWVSDRFGWGPIWENALDRRVAKGSWYYGDGATLLLLLGVQVATGAVMMLTYAPSPDAAYASVRDLTERQWLGWFVRGLHYWSAGLMVVMLVFHLCRQLLVAGYKSPREGTWLIGVLLFFGVITMAFTGYLLRWDERAVYGFRVAMHMFYRVPVIGEPLVLFVQGGPDVGARTLTRLYAVHVIFVPLLLLGLAAYHLYLVMVHGVTSPTERQKPVGSAEEQKKLYKDDAHSEDRGETFYPTTMVRSGMMGAVVFGLAIALTILVGPQQLYPEANLDQPSMPVEEWWFWWYSALIALMPPAIAPVLVVVFPVLLFVALVALPFVDRSPRRGIRKRPLWAIFVVILILSLIYLTDLRRRSPWTGWPDPEPPPMPAGIEPTAEVEQGRLLFAQYGCNSCHAVAGHGREVGTDLATLQDRYSRSELRAYILRPPEGVPMPGYEGRLSEEELERLVDFVHVVQTYPRQ